MDEIITKKCSKCGQIKPVSKFNKHKNCLYGVRPDCKQCSYSSHKKWTENNREELRVYQNQKRKDNTERFNGYAKKTYWKDIEKTRKYAKEKSVRLRQEAIQKYGGRCACCGEDRYEFMAVDHINGGGNKERRDKKVGGGSNFYRYLKSNGWPSGYRILCHNCNHSLGSYGYCPHEK